MSPSPSLTAETRVLIVEDQGMMNAFFVNWLAQLPRFTLAGTARSGEDAVALLESAQPDVALVDFQLPWMDGLQFIRLARQIRPELRCLVVTSLVDPLTLSRVREAGVEGYVEKDAAPETLAEALVTVANGRPYHSPLFRDTLAREDAKAQGLAKILSRREQQVLAGVVAGKSNREIAELLGLSARTVEFHRLNFMAKLDATDVIQLMATVRKRGWLAALQSSGKTPA